jgi:hypothetical protein
MFARLLVLLEQQQQHAADDDCRQGTISQQHN